MPLSGGPKPQVHRRLLSDEVHDHIRDAILDGSLTPGETLEDANLQEWLGVSRSPIRDALKRLQYEGLVTIHAQSSTKVATPDGAEIEKSMQAFGAIIGGVVRIAVPELSDSARQHLLGLIETARVEAEAQQPEAHLDATLAVYEALLTACSNGPLVRIAHSSLLPLKFGYRVLLGVRTPRWDVLVVGWEKFHRGLAAGDNVLAELAIEEMHLLPLPDLGWDSTNWDAVTN